jgi:hypothetical protein
MKSKGIQPTNHTYKLLVDTHATLEPINMAAAEAVLDVIRSTGQNPEAVHYSSLIHAKGCALHDMDGARAVFDAVMADPSIRPQPCLYQALFEAMVANHRVADTESVLRDMSARKVEMTPYIANTLIHGWANEKKIEKSKAIFSSVSHDKREPSTYEAMTRAYLAVEDRLEQDPRIAWWRQCRSNHLSPVDSLTVYFHTLAPAHTVNRRSCYPHTFPLSLIPVPLHISDRRWVGYQG